MCSRRDFGIDCLTKDNYDTWKIQMKAVLILNDAWGYVNGAIPKPEGDGAADWSENDMKAMSDLILNIGEPELRLVRGCSTSREVWLKLESIYQSKQRARRVELLSKLTLARMPEEANIRDHLNDFFDVVDKLRQMEIHVNDDLLTILILNSLPASFENFRRAIKSRDKLPAPEVLKVKILEESDAREDLKCRCPQNAIYSSNHEGSGTSKCKKTTKTCKRFSCEKHGHEIVSGQMSAHTGTKYKWCLGSSVSSHISKESGSFLNISPVQNQYLKLATNGSCKVAASGTAHFTARVDGHPKEFTFEALHVPDLRTNLLSVSKMTDKGYKVVFKKHSAMIYDKDGRLSLRADRVGDLYFVKE